MAYINLIFAMIVAAAILISSADDRKRREFLKDLDEAASRRAQKTAYAAEETRLEAEATRRTAEINENIEKLKLERTRILKILSETDREAFEKLLNAPLIEKTEVKLVQVPVPMPYPMPYWWGTRF